ncbi:trafficking protein Mon1-domain-containing protein [Gamsiella multidivaricata]|uniref:trafficking protein Mon1-domain-containing protein n=1 Tax=Gamsiella multidivaricata TaxID=101098 RepID=UPI0022204EB4|nr:trafficking protein Mon1-domain-containing protein [Gamsiella multidivaricata]KAI7817921.1 trafficking protein Mon1-domain-containing protein [Gamsiella multidivaricata]
MNSPSSSSNGSCDPAAVPHPASPALLSPSMHVAASSSSPLASPRQSAISPRLMPTKSWPTTALVLDQQRPPQHQQQQQQQQDTESVSSDEFMLSSASSTTKGGQSKKGSTDIAHAASRAFKGLALPAENTQSSHLEHNQDQGLDSESSEEDGRLTDTENHHQYSTTALESLREIEEHDRGDRQGHGIDTRYRTITLSPDQDQNSEAGDCSDVQPEAALDANQIQDKLKVLRPKHSNLGGRPKSRLQRSVSTKSYDSDDISNNYGGYQKHYGSEDHTASSWTAHRKHFFILSSAGKPIYARYGDESRISSYMGVIQALISFFADNDDTIRCINAGQHKFVFLLKTPLYLVCVSRTGESESQLRDQLGYLYAQIISVLTHSQMTKIFEQRNNFDLRGLIGGTEIFLDSLGKLMNTYPGFMLGAIQCLTMPRELRDKVGAVLGRAKCKPLLYAILLTPTQLITLLRPRTHSMHPSDLHLIFNLLSGSTTFESSESWTPICLPKFNNKSFLHAYICYIAKKVCMLLISPDKDSFFEMSSVKQKVVEGLEAGGMLASLESHAAAGSRGGFSVGDTGIPGLRHFLYKSRTNVQFTMPELMDPYSSLSARKRLLRQYQHMHERMHRKTRPLKLLFHVGEHETMLGWITSSFELYAAFGPLVSKSAVVLMSNKLLKWIRKQEDSLLILNSPSFEKFK